jgi:hypothetical protein
MLLQTSQELFNASGGIVGEDLLKKIPIPLTPSPFGCASQSLRKGEKEEKTRILLASLAISLFFIHYYSKRPG